MSMPRIKRQFAGSSADPSQRQITSFFASRAPGEAGDEPPQPQPPRQPRLPSSVQSNLLSVGMRVRKSVPEGYKTSGTSAFKLWTDKTKPPAMCGPLTKTRMGASSRELLPFCGINKVGGLDSQPVFRSDDEDESAPELDDVPGLTMSQESVDSNAPEPSRKRGHNDDERPDCPTLLALPSKGWDDEVSPRSFAPSQWGNSRVMAVPRTRLKKRPSLKDMGQENMAVDGDFGEADFLVSCDERDMDLS
ncbi:Ribonucleotide reductase inhibitor [Metarhizium album ARSEF 1941]|uniref:Ribonucleotide reductase inhibitor n=1 Tax=Metarhizium album (strain ARSEF 1941) TaxID=1081103 RepID=A0A0B2WYF6_METAS|nr:Ribonucleotide reductase inhibitor [Metarhizium album ARSEF 1941]KHO01282.1 Ribonucleotide reductase inhibitor [Metarhizium album ARSEF 1941]